MIHLLSQVVIKSLVAERKVIEKKNSEDEHRSMFEKYSATERFEDILNTLKGIYFKLELSEKKKDKPDFDFISRISQQRLYLADIQQRYIKGFSIKMMEDALRNDLIPELRSLQKQYPDI